MDFRVELSEQAQGDIAAIYDWLESQLAGDAGTRWFVALGAAIESLNSFLSLPETPSARKKLPIAHDY